MPVVVAFKFSQEEIPSYYLLGPLADNGLRVQDFCVAPREGLEDVGFVSALEVWSSHQVRPDRRLPSLIRRATQSEIDRWWEVKALERRALLTCKQKVVEHALPMKVSTVRYEAKNNKLAFQFTSDKRVDFRALVRDLAALLRARIELWQIGVREEARAQDGFGVCGLQTCCSSWIRDFRPITLKMAKEQDIDLPPSKLTGQCGRLLCCLSYEVDAYRELSREALPRGTTIVHRAGQGVVVDRNLLRRTYLVSDEQGVLTTVASADIREFALPEQMKHMGKKILAGLAREAEERATTGEGEVGEESPFEDAAQERVVVSSSTDPVLTVSPEDVAEEGKTLRRDALPPPPSPPAGPPRPARTALRGHSAEGISRERGPNRPSGPPRPRPPMTSLRKEALDMHRERPERDGTGGEPQRPPRIRRRGRGGRRGGRSRPPGGGGGSGTPPPQGPSTR